MSKLKKVLIKAKRQIFSEMIGNNPSRFHGEGYDFSELREYQIGDDIKHIDWNITAKMQKPYVKVFKEERELHVSLVSMMGGSLYFGSQKMKQDVVAEIMALLSFSVVKNQDLLSSYMVQEKLSSLIRPSKKEFAIHKATDALLTCETLNHVANYKELGHLLMKEIKHKSLVVIVGDFFEIPDLNILSKRHEVVAIIVRDKLEEHPHSMGFSALIDPQTGQTLEGEFGKNKVSAYAKKVAAHDHELFASFKKSRIRFSKIYTDDNPYVAIKRLFGAL
jgi:uncharacterized protein (DUF58 family)